MNGGVRFAPLTRSGAGVEAGGPGVPTFLAMSDGPMAVLSRRDAGRRAGGPVLGGL